MDKPKIEDVLKHKGRDFSGIIDGIRDLVDKANIIDDLEKEQTIFFRGKNKERLEGFIGERIAELERKYGKIKTQVSMKNEGEDYVFEMDWKIIKD